jgi:hypothetical protein
MLRYKNPDALELMGPARYCVKLRVQQLVCSGYTMVTSPKVVEFCTHYSGGISLPPPLRSHHYGNSQKISQPIPPRLGHHRRARRVVPHLLAVRRAGCPTQAHEYTQTN